MTIALVCGCRKNNSGGIWQNINWLISYLGLISLLLIACNGNESKQSASRNDSPIPVTFIPATPVDMPVSLETIAQTEGAKEIEIRPRVGGILLQRLYTEGVGG
jgi:membrane fusion protein (multidrug efflux system)